MGSVLLGGRSEEGGVGGKYNESAANLALCLDFKILFVQTVNYHSPSAFLSNDVNLVISLEVGVDVHVEVLSRDALVEAQHVLYVILKVGSPVEATRDEAAVT